MIPQMPHKIINTTKRVPVVQIKWYSFEKRWINQNKITATNRARNPITPAASPRDLSIQTTPPQASKVEFK